MNKDDFIRKAIDENIADKEGILNNILNSCSDDMGVKNKRFRYKKRVAKLAVSFAVIAAIVCTGVFINLPSDKSVQTRKGKKITQKANMFTLVAYAIENTNSKNQPNASSIKPETKTVLNSNVKVQMPSGKIRRGRYNTYTDEDGKVYKGYEAEIDDGLGFVCTGDNIESVTFISLNGNMHYFDVDLLKKMEANGELYICKIPIPNSKIKPEWGTEKIKKAFNEMWLSGELDEYKNKYFEGKNIDLDDYTIGISSTWTPNSASTYMTIANKQSGLPAYFKAGPSVTAKPDSTVNWVPAKAMDMLIAKGPVNYQDLPGDTITVTAKFTDGQTLTQTIIMSFDKEGNIMAELKKN